MCTAVSFRKNGFYFGRTLDNDLSYGEEAVVAPRGYMLRKGGATRYKIAGIATVINGLPLYYDGMNEKGLCMAGLNFASSAHYGNEAEGKINLAQYELLPFILGECATVDEAESALADINITCARFAPDVPPAPLHWMISDGFRDIAAECTRSGLKVFSDPVGVLTNEPPFGRQLFNLGNYMSLTSGDPPRSFAPGLNFEPYCCGMGALGLPGDWSSASRFVRAAFVRNNYVPDAGESGADALFAILSCVAVPRGCCRTAHGWQTTLYACCMDAARGEYVCKTRGGKTAVLSLGGFEGSDLLRQKLPL